MQGAEGNREVLSLKTGSNRGGVLKNAGNGALKERGVLLQLLRYFVYYSVHLASVVIGSVFGCTGITESHFNDYTVW